MKNQDSNSIALASILAIIGAQSILELVKKIKEHALSDNLGYFLVCLNGALVHASTQSEKLQGEPVDAKACEALSAAIMRHLSPYLGNGANGRTDMGIRLKSAFNGHRLAFRKGEFCLVAVKKAAKGVDLLAVIREVTDNPELTAADAADLIRAQFRVVELSGVESDAA